MRKLRDWRFVGKPSDIAEVMVKFAGFGVASSGEYGLFSLRVEKRDTTILKLDSPFRFIFMVSAVGGHNIVGVADNRGKELKSDPAHPDCVEAVCPIQSNTLLRVMLAPQT